MGETRNHFLEAVKQNKLMSTKPKNICTTLNYIEHFLILTSTISECISVSAFVFLLGILIGITSSAIGLKTYALTAGIKNDKSTTKKKKNHHKIVLFAKTKLNSIESINF